MAEYVVQAGKDIGSVTEYLKYGDRVVVEDGNFDSVAVKVSGVTYKALNPRKAITGQWVWSSGINDVIIKGFEAVNSSYNAFQLSKGNSNNLIQNCGIHTRGTCGVDIANNGNDNIVEDCDIHNMHYAFHTSSSANYRNIFRRNHCRNLTGDIVSITSSSIGTKILYNILHDAEDDGIHCFDDGKAEVIGNLVYNCKGVPLWVNGNGGIVTRNNTVIGLAPKDWKTMVIWIEKNNHIFRNNIIYTEHPDMKLLVGSGDIDYNCWYKKDVVGVPYGTNGIYADPKFMDIANNDYRLRADSPCIDMGYDIKPVEPIPELVPEPEPQPEPTPEYVKKSVLIEALQEMIEKIKGV